MNKKTIFLLVCFIFSVKVWAQKRTEINIPDIQGYKTLKCDFHIHTVFSDGNVWPTIRIDEAWREGLDVIALTDHIEYQPHKKDVNADHNRSFEIAEPAAKNSGILLIRGSEITRSMPPGHSNALFLTDCNALDTKDYIDAFKAAKSQDAFIFWNHPDWSRQQPDTTLWWKEHTDLYNAGLLHGIEVVNGDAYSPLAHRWCIEKKLTLMGTSDIHNPMGMDYDFSKGEHRPITLVFAKEKSTEAVKDALVNHRTVVYYKTLLIGDQKYLNEIISKSIKIEKVIRSGKRISVVIFNQSSVPFEFKKVKGNDSNLEFFRDLTVEAGAYTKFDIYEKEPTGNTYFNLKVVISNLLIAPETGLPYTLEITAN
jgi:3',5'-nucleoside bisphosphate phosphatase